MIEKEPVLTSSTTALPIWAKRRSQTPSAISKGALMRVLVSLHLEKGTR